VACGHEIRALKELRSLGGVPQSIGKRKRTPENREAPKGVRIIVGKNGRATFLKKPRQKTAAFPCHRIITL